MTATVKCRIAVLVGSNGQVAALDVKGEPDWGLLADCIMNPDNTDPDASNRYIVEVEVPLPSTPVIEAEALPA